MQRERPFKPVKASKYLYQVVCFERVTPLFSGRDGVFSLIDTTYKNSNQMISKRKRVRYKIRRSTVFLLIYHARGDW